MDTRRSEWEEEKEFTSYQVRDMSLKNYKNLLTSGRWSNKYHKYYQILALLGLAKNLADDSKKSSDKSNTSKRESTKGDPYYIRDLPPWMLEYPKYRVGDKYKDGK